MSEKTKPVDVLGDIAWAIRELCAEDLPNCAAHLTLVHARVAELIAADVEYDEAHRAWKNGAGAARDRERWYTAQERRAAAIAAFRSGATP